MKISVPMLMMLMYWAKKLQWRKIQKLYYRLLRRLV